MVRRQKLGEMQYSVLQVALVETAAISTLTHGKNGHVYHEGCGTDENLAKRHVRVNERKRGEGAFVASETAPSATAESGLAESTVETEVLRPPQTVRKSRQKRNNNTDRGQESVAHATGVERRKRSENSQESDGPDDRQQWYDANTETMVDVPEHAQSQQLPAHGRSQKHENLSDRKVQEHITRAARRRHRDETRRT